MSLELDLDVVIREAFGAVPAGNFIREHSSQRAVDVLNLSLDNNQGLVLQSVLRLCDEDIILGFIQTMILSSMVTKTIPADGFNSEAGVNKGLRSSPLLL